MNFAYPRTPYDKYAVIEGAWSDALLDRCKAECDSLPWKGGGHTTGSLAKFSCQELSPSLKAVVDEASSPRFLTWLEETTRIEHLMPDPYLWGGGAHRTKAGGYLKCHTDFNFHRQLGLYRRLNLLLYLNRDWRWNGHLQLYSKRIAPEANTMVVFTTNDKSWHGHPEPLECPEGVFRDSIALYYYSAIKPTRNFAELRPTTEYEP